MQIVLNTLRKKRLTANEKYLTLPEAILKIDQDSNITDTLNDIDLAQEEKSEYLHRMHKNIDKIVDTKQ